MARRGKSARQNCLGRSPSLGNLQVPCPRGWTSSPTSGFLSVSTQVFSSQGNSSHYLTPFRNRVNLVYPSKRNPTSRSPHVKTLAPRRKAHQSSCTSLKTLPTPAAAEIVKFLAALIPSETAQLEYQYHSATGGRHISHKQLEVLKSEDFFNARRISKNHASSRWQVVVGVERDAPGQQMEIEA
jgi:hypothetical protein